MMHSGDGLSDLKSKHAQGGSIREQHCDGGGERKMIHLSDCLENIVVENWNLDYWKSCCLNGFGYYY